MNDMYDLLQEVEYKRAMYIEMYAAAFLQEVGSEKASNYILVERTQDGKITWSFELKNNETSI